MGNLKVIVAKTPLSDGRQTFFINIRSLILLSFRQQALGPALRFEAGLQPDDPGTRNTILSVKACPGNTLGTTLELRERAAITTAISYGEERKAWPSRLPP